MNCGCKDCSFFIKGFYLRRLLKYWFGFAVWLWYSVVWLISCYQISCIPSAWVNENLFSEATCCGAVGLLKCLSRCLQCALWWSLKLKWVPEVWIISKLPCYGIVHRVKVHFCLDPRLLEDVAWFQTQLNHVCLGAALSATCVYTHLCFLERRLLNSCICLLVICHKLHYCLEFYSSASQLFLLFCNILNCSDFWPWIVTFRHAEK